MTEKDFGPFSLMVGDEVRVRSGGMYRVYKVRESYPIPYAYLSYVSGPMINKYACVWIGGRSNFIPHIQKWSDVVEVLTELPPLESYL